MFAAGRSATWPAVAAIVALAGLVAVVTSPSPAGADTARWVRSNFESTFGMKVARDCGFSEPIPGQTGENLWVFCDTGIFDSAGRMVRYFAGSSAARGATQAGAMPATLSELPTPGAALDPVAIGGHVQSARAPAPFVPAPSGLVRPDGSPCVQARRPGTAASWITGVVQLPDTARVLLTYVDVCITKLWEWTTESFGMVEYDPASNRLHNRATLFAERSGRKLMDPLHLGSPVVAGGDLHLFASVCDVWIVGACSGGQVLHARVPLDRRTDPSAYRFQDSSGGWSADPVHAASILPGGRPAGIHVDTVAAVRGEGALALVETTTIGGTYRIWEASDPAGPWSVQGGERQLDGCTAPAGKVDFCRALVVQPELSTSQTLGLTHYAVADEHVRVSSIPW